VAKLFSLVPGHEHFKHGEPYIGSPKYPILHFSHFFPKVLLWQFRQSPLESHSSEWPLHSHFKHLGNW